jgi:hypothetical protein
MRRSLWAELMSVTRGRSKSGGWGVAAPDSVSVSASSASSGASSMGRDWRRSSSQEEELVLHAFGAGQAPLRDGHFLEVEQFDPGARLPLVLQGGAEFVEIGFGFAERGEDDGAGTKAVFEVVHAGGCLTRGGFGAGGLLRIEAVGLDLFFGRHKVSFQLDGSG